MHDTGVSLELDPGGCDNGPELLGCQGPKPYGNPGFQVPMTLKGGQVLGTAVGCLGEGPVGAEAANSTRPQCQPESGGR